MNNKTVNVDFVARAIEIDLNGKEHFIAAALAAEQAIKAKEESAASVALIKTRKALWYENVAAMKADKSINAGSYVNTAGYYKVNDGGGGSYIIRAKTIGDVEDGGSIHFLQKELVAELIVEKDGWVNSKQLGLDNQDKDSKNLEKIAKAINKGYKILVADMYNINGSVTQQCGKDIILKGDGDNCGFTYGATAPAYLFDAGISVKSISFKNLTFINAAKKTNTYTALTYIVCDIDVINMEHYECVNCTFVDGATLARENINIYNNVYELPYIKQINVSNNKIIDCGYSFAQFNDICFDTFLIHNNTVNNFDYTLFTAANTNLPVDASPEWQDKYDRLFKGMNSISVVGNTAINDDGCINKTLDDGYYCFIIAECQAVLYDKNRVEGIKASGNMAVYDAYLSCRNVTYTNNIWRNNICFGYNEAEWANKNNYLIKCKGGGGYRYYYANTFESTKEFIDMLVTKYQAVRDNCWVGLVSLTSDCDIDIKDNVFKIELLSFLTANTRAKNYNFSNNRMNIGKVLLGALLFSTNSAAKADASTVFVNNNIIVDRGSVACCIVDNQVTPVNVVDNKITIKNGNLSYNAKPCPNFHFDNNEWCFDNGKYNESFSHYSNHKVVARRCNLASGANLNDEFVYDIHTKIYEDSNIITLGVDNQKDGAVYIKGQLINRVSRKIIDVDIFVKLYTENAVKKMEVFVDGKSILNDIVNPPSTTWFTVISGFAQIRRGGSDSAIYLLTDNGRALSNFSVDLKIKNIKFE